MKFRVALWVVLSATALPLSAVSVADPIFSGEYFYNFENSLLTPDGKKEEWCIDPRLMTRAMLPAKDGNGPWGTSHVVVRGQLGPPGR